MVTMMSGYLDNEKRKRSPFRATSQMQVAFEQEFERAILANERIRAWAVAGVMCIGLSSFLIAHFFFGGVYQQAFQEKLPIAWVLIFFVALISYELGSSLLFTHFMKTGRKLLNRTRYFNALIEISIPSLGMGLMAQIREPILILFSPIPFIYFLLILLTALRLDTRLCLFTGTIAGIQYMALSIYLSNQSHYFASIDPNFPPLFPEVQKAIMLLSAGLLASLVAFQIRQRINIALESALEKNQILQVFGEHVSPIVVNKLLAQKAGIVSEIRYVCVMFLDIRGFTHFAEAMPPEEVVDYLNRLFHFMIEIVNQHHGIINKFLGDGFMAVFGAPLSNGNDSYHAVNAALEIVARVEQEVLLGTIPPTRVGIGLHAGEAVTGNVGSSLRREYTVIGDVVNLAARIEQMNKQFNSQVLISETVQQAILPIAHPMTEIGTVPVRGRENPIQLYQLV